jgi:hypothetical protein
VQTVVRRGRRAVDDDDRGQSGQVGVFDLRGLGGVLRDEHRRARVAQDVDRVFGFGRRVDRRGGRAGAHHPEVGEDPFEPGVGEDRHPVLRADAEVDQAGRDRGGPLADLPPGQPDRVAGVAGCRVRERGTLGCFRDPVEEHLGDGAVAQLDLLGHGGVASG